MNLTGEYVPGLNFPVCNMFKPVIQDGQPCYSLNINSVIPKKDRKTRRGIENGILIAIDTDQITAFEMEDILETREHGRGQLRAGPVILERSETVSISTLERYTDSCDMKGCSYKMATLKKMTGTDSFLALSDKIKGCQIEPHAECKQRKLLEETQQRCGCLPWALNIFEPVHVSITDFTES